MGKYKESLYNLGKHLGKGTFGQVKLGQHTLTNEKVSELKLIIKF